ncbi:MAG: porin, partial [Gammaproteobacteria bacterium]
AGRGGGGPGATRIGGYGELHYRALERTKEIDFHRAVLFVGHDFDERIRLYTEWDLEHADTGEQGGLELEQAFLAFRLAPGQELRAGAVLVPLGIINESHEPPVFYGVERPPVATAIIPSTWREGGVQLRGELGPRWRYDLALTSGLATDPAGPDAFVVRKARQAVSEARAEDLAYTARLRWLPAPGLELGLGAFHQQDITQNQGAAVPATLWAAHGVWRAGPWALKAVYAAWRLDGSAARALGRDEQWGAYLEPSWRVREDLGLYARYSAWDGQAGDAADSERRQSELGLSWWPHPRVVVKGNYQWQEGPGHEDGLSLGVGYDF